MAFRSFRHHPAAEPALAALLARGEDVLDRLKRQIQRVQAEWEPEEDGAQYIVPFEGYFLVFTAAQEDESVLVLAGAEPQPGP